MSDAKYFQRGKVQELRNELVSDKRDSKYAKKKATLKRIVANMTMGNDMSALFPDVIACLSIPNLEVKKMVYLYVTNYCRSKPDMARMAAPYFEKARIDVNDSNPLIRALAIRSMGYIHIDRVVDGFCDPLRHCLRDPDPYVRKTAAVGVAKLFMHDPSLAESEGFLEILRSMLSDSNPAVVSNAVAALVEISERSPNYQLEMNMSTANRLANTLNECSEWGQGYILEALLYAVPQEVGEAELLAERVVSRLQHANSFVVLATVKLLVYLMNYMSREEDIKGFSSKLGPPLITLLSHGPEVQYVALRNILLVIQKYPEMLHADVHTFFCKYDEPIYIKLSKLEIIFRLTTEDNAREVLSELREYASEIDIDFVRRAVRCIGRLGIKLVQSSQLCISLLLELIQTRVSYVVQEAVIVMKDIFRRYPNKYENVIPILCENLDDLDQPEAKVAMIWIIGQYAERIDHAEAILESFVDTFKEEHTEVQLALLTAVVKLFLKRPAAGQDLVPKILKWATEEVDNPDLRDRGFIYWRLLSTNPTAAKSIILSDKPEISTEADHMDPIMLEELLLHIANLSSIYHKSPTMFINGAKIRTLPVSQVLNTRSIPVS
ncbi:putative beta-adaptin [Syncephalis plumigaleata]|nr:putative beta-adaptin [Syncephalis plumigaleata]